MFALSFLTASLVWSSSTPKPIPHPAVSNAPVAQMLVPGFSIYELPLSINNINNIVYAPDGRCFVLGYSGNIWQLKDSNGDRLEDQAVLFWDNKNGEVPASIGMCWGPGGLYIATKGRILHLKDQTPAPPQLVVITEGWVPPAKFGGSNLDAVGIAADKEGNLYFGLGCDDWTGAYRINEKGTSDYNIRSERGTILKVRPDGTREIIATGLRWPVALQFNHLGDLFCTDQEGATWLPNGNPFDELLHIQKNRHYGFPPKHPVHLPEVMDEPSVFDYGPQHQSTCGLHFNHREKTFGPAFWMHDAFVSGESRGKIWRTETLKTPHGYVARNHLVACFNLLTVDAAPTPQGDMLVACHTGAPDWGTGPQGKGRLFKIVHSNPQAPQPVMAWAQQPTELCVAFDRPVPADFFDLAQVQVQFGKTVAAGDAFEKVRPGYRVVQDQMRVPRYELPVSSTAWSADRSILKIKTAEMKASLPWMISIATRSTNRAPQEVAQQARMEVAGSLQGVLAQWQGKNEREKLEAWLPSWDLPVARELTVDSPFYREFWKSIQRPGTLTMKGQFDSWQMLRAPTQSGSKLDFEYPAETVQVTFENVKTLSISDRKNVSLKTQGSNIIVSLASKPDDYYTVEAVYPTGNSQWMRVHWSTQEDERPRPLALHRMIVPFALPTKASEEGLTKALPELKGADWKRGRQVFLSEKAACSKCHTVRSEGGRIGPDLSNLVHRDYQSVLKDIRDPNASMNPEQLAYEVSLKDGDILVGLLVKQSEKEVVITEASGQTLNIPRLQVQKMQTSKKSLMPEGLLENLSATEIRDLMAFLLMERP